MIDFSKISTSQAREHGLYAVHAHFDITFRRLVVTLASGIKIEVPVHIVQGLQNAESYKLIEIEISPSGMGLHFPDLDADVLVLGLLAGVMGNPKWMKGHSERLNESNKMDDHRVIHFQNSLDDDEDLELAESYAYLLTDEMILGSLEDDSSYISERAAEIRSEIEKLKEELADHRNLFVHSKPIKAR